ncbi:hypothetical protein JNW91_26935, partial [Micromonospora sp. STR1_7]|nr:hypothetical protein [Micromonospora parastrephiae]
MVDGAGRQDWSTDREQSHRAEAEQCQRVEVLLAPAQPPVQAGRRRAARVARQQLAQWRTGGDRLAGADGRPYRLVGGPQPVGVAHGDHRAPATRPAKSTVPGPALRITAPAVAARSTPRCPASH